MSLEVVIGTRRNKEITVHILTPDDFSARQPKKNIDMVVVDSSFFDYRESSPVSDLRKIYPGRMMFVEPVVDEIEQWPISNKSRRLINEISELIKDEKRVNLKSLSTQHPVHETMRVLDNLDGAVAKRIAFQDFIGNFGEIYKMCNKLADDVLGRSIADVPWPRRKDDVDKIMKRIFRNGRKLVSPQANIPTFPNRVEYAVAHKIFEEYLTSLPAAVYDAINSANMRNGHVTEFPKLKRHMQSTKTPWLFKRYWNNSYLSNMFYMFRRTIHYAIDGYDLHSAYARIMERFGSTHTQNVPTDVQVVAAAAQFNVNGGDRIILSKDRDIGMLTLMLSWTKRKQRQEPNSYY